MSNQACDQNSEIGEDQDDFDYFLTRVYPHLRSAEKEHHFLIEHSLSLDPDMKQDKSGNLIIPLLSVALKVTAFLFISNRGKPRFFGSEKSRFAMVNRRSRKRGQPIYVTEDYASAKTIAEATDAKAIASLTSEPLSNFADSIQVIFPDSQIVIATGIDEKNQSQAPSVQTNLRSYGVIYPYFDTAMRNTASSNSFNDLKKERGIMEVRRQIRMKLSRLAELQESNNIRSR